MGHLTSSYTNGINSFAQGQRVITNANNNVTFGLGGTNTWLDNIQTNSFMVGFNSNAPTFYVSSASGNGTTGNVGIGGPGYRPLGTPNPLEKLEVWNGNIAQTNVDLITNTGASSGNSSTNLLGATGGGCNVFGLTTNNYNTINPIPGIANTFLQIGIDGSNAVVNYDDASSINFNTTVGPLCSNPYTTVLKLSGLSAPAQVELFGTCLVNTLPITSDERFKQNIKNVENGYSLIKKLRPVSYTFKVNDFPERNLPKEKSYGLIAQELKQLLPELVHENTDGYLSVNYISLIPFLISAIQEQSTEINNLRDSIGSNLTNNQFNNSLINNSDSIAPVRDSVIQALQEEIRVQSIELTEQKNIIAELESKVNQILECINKSNICISGNLKENSGSELELGNTDLYYLGQNHPNPVSEKITSISYKVPEISEKVSMQFYNTIGTLIYSADNLKPGEGIVEVNTTSFISGTYYYSLFVNEKKVKTLKLTKTAH